MNLIFSPQSWLQRFPKQTRLILVTVAYGLAAGLVAVGFQSAMNAVYHFGLVALSKQSPTNFLVGSLILMVGAALFVGWMLSSFCPEASGSGVPQLKAALWKDFGFVPARVIWVKFIAGVIQIGTGSSLGREGPSVQLAGAIGSNLAGFAGEPKQRRRHGATTGAAAGLAAAFNTPLAAVTFVLEELIGDLNSRLLGSILLAAMIGALVTHAVFGPQPAFTLEVIREPSWRAYMLVPVVSIFASLVGVAFQKSSLKLRLSNRRNSRTPPWMRPAVGALICWALGTLVFFKTGRLGVFALGYDDLSDALAGKLAWQIAALLLAAKFVATVACYGMGGCGGIFSPTLFFGAMTGIITAGIASFVIPIQADGVAMLAVIGMSSTLGAAVRAPVTSILIVFEMTHQFALVPPLMLGALVSQTISRKMLRRNFYDALLEQDGHDLERFTPPRDLTAWHRQSVSALANPTPIVLESLHAPTVEEVISRHPYQAFPVMDQGVVIGVLNRIEARAALKTGHPPLLQPVVVCGPNDTIKQAEQWLVEKGARVAVVMSPDGSRVSGIFTLHDLLRAQLAASDSSDESV